LCVVFVDQFHLILYRKHVGPHLDNLGQNMNKRFCIIFKPVVQNAFISKGHGYVGICDLCFKHASRPEDT